MKNHDNKKQQILPAKNIPEHPLLRYAIAQMIFAQLPDIDHSSADWIYYKDPLYDAAQEIIERFIDTARPIAEYGLNEGTNHDAGNSRDRSKRSGKAEIQHLPVDNSEPRSSYE